MSISAPDINISLEPHLVQSLARIFPLLPHELLNELEKYIADPAPPLIPYKTLQAVSQWTRTEHGKKSLKTHDIDPYSYVMISLLAGTTTSPERKFGNYIPRKEPEEIEANRIRERRAITVLLNALLSIGGVGFAAWWAADKTGWKDEWRVLFALFAAIVVAVAEAGLYLIWQSRQSKPNISRMKRRSAKHKKVDPLPETNPDPVVSITTSEGVSSLRQRR